MEEMCVCVGGEGFPTNEWFRKYSFYTICEILVTYLIKKNVKKY